MFVRKMMISGLQKQQEILRNLIQEIENKSELAPSDWGFCEDRTQKVARNLRMGPLADLGRDFARGAPVCQRDRNLHGFYMILTKT